MAEKAQPTANVSNGSTPSRPPIKREDTDKDLDDYFVRVALDRLTQLD